MSPSASQPIKDDIPVSVPFWQVSRLREGETPVERLRRNGSAVASPSQITANLQQVDEGRVFLLILIKKYANIQAEDYRGGNLCCPEAEFRHLLMCSIC